jgi:hypothetical protein
VVNAEASLAERKNAQYPGGREPGQDCRAAPQAGPDQALKHTTKKTAAKEMIGGEQQNGKIRGLFSEPDCHTSV